MKRLFALVLVLCILLSGCAAPRQYSLVYLDLFDTVTTVKGTASSEAAFSQTAQDIYTRLAHFHKLFDIYNDYEGLTNLKTVNDMAGIAPVVVDSAIIELLLACKDYCTLTGGTVNAAMGSVLQLWHQARTAALEDPETARLPAADALSEAAKHTDFDDVIIDEAASTVYIRDPLLRLDVGAIAKGWVCQKIVSEMPEGWLISLGGNVCVTGAKGGDTPWIVGIQNPDGSDYLQTLALTKGAAVTSGDYQRTYTVDGKAYHHIIDPATGMPGGDFRSVTVVCDDAALADALSTALFLLPLEEGQALAQRCNVQALWLDAQNQQHTTPGFRELIP